MRLWNRSGRACLLVALLVMTAPGLGLAQRQMGRELLPVAVTTIDYVEAKSNGGLTAFVDSEVKGRGDSAKDILVHLRSRARQHVRPVGPGQTPVVEVIVLKREYVEVQDEAHIITARIVAAGSAREVTSVSDSWRNSAMEFTKQLDAWVGANKDALKGR